MKTKTTPKVDRTFETLAALKQFKEGDRVYNRLEKKHGYYQAANFGQAMPNCWVKYFRWKSDEWQLDVTGYPTDPLDLQICNESCHFFLAALPYAAERSPMLESKTNLELPNSLKQTNTDGMNSQSDIPESSAMTMLEPLVESGEAGMLLLEAHHARTIPEQIQVEPDSLESDQDYGGKCSESLENQSLSSSSGKMLLPPDTQPQEIDLALYPMLSGVLPASATFVNGSLLAQKPLERPISENGSYLLLPTPMAHSRAKTSTRPPGQDKLEQKLRELGVVPPGEITTPEFRNWMMGISSPDTIEVDGGEIIYPQSKSAQPLEVSQCAESKSSLSETLALPSKERSLGRESIASLEELTIDEERLRHRLEIRVERAFYEAGSALRDLRDKRLYRSTHKTFEEYCKDRFGFTRYTAYNKIASATVFDNLLTIGQQILPTNERQVRDLTNLEPDEQRQIWQEAVEQSNGKVPSGAKVKGIVERMKEKTFVPLPECAQYAIGDVVIIKAHGNSTLRPYDGYWAIVERISDYFYHLCLSLKEEKISHDAKDVTPLLGCKGDEVERVELSQEDKLLFKSVSDRIRKLAQRNDLETPVLGILEALSRKTVFTKGDLWFLERAEEWHDINQ